MNQIQTTQRENQSQTITREEQARALVSSKMSQINIIVGNDKAKASAFGSAIVNMANDYNLNKCSVDSIVNTAMQIVQIGLHPNKLFGQAYVVPFRLKNGGETAQLQIGYKGLIALGMRNGWKFRAVAVYECDEFALEFAGIEDKITFVPNYEERNDADGNWVFDNLKGVLVYAIDKSDNRYSEFVSRSKLEKIRLKSQNQNKADKLDFIWLEWAEEMYKAKALKYVASRLPINDKLAEAVNIEDEPIRAEVKIEAPKTKDLNQLLQSKTENAPENATVKENLTVEPIEVEIESDYPVEKLYRELVARGVSDDDAEHLTDNIAPQEAQRYLADPSSIDTLLEDLKG